MIKGNLCYVVYPKSASFSTRKFLEKLNFNKPLGIYGHDSIENIIKKTNKEDYVFFSVYRDSEKHCISSYIHITTSFKNPKSKNFGLDSSGYKCWKDIVEKNNIHDFDSWLNYLENYNYNWGDGTVPHLFTNYSDFFYNKKVIMLKPGQVKKFIEEQLNIKTNFNMPHINNNNNTDIILTEKQKERIKNIYKKNQEYIEENKWSPL